MSQAHTQLSIWLRKKELLMASWLDSSANLESVTLNKKKKTTKNPNCLAKLQQHKPSPPLSPSHFSCAHSYYNNPRPKKEKTLITLPVTVRTLKLGIFGAPVGFVVPRNTRLLVNQFLSPISTKSLFVPRAFVSRVQLFFKGIDCPIQLI
jgi:hypothetical protein